MSQTNNLAINEMATASIIEKQEMRISLFFKTTLFLVPLLALLIRFEGRVPEVSIEFMVCFMLYL